MSLDSALARKVSRKNVINLNKTIRREMLRTCVNLERPCLSCCCCFFFFRVTEFDHITLDLKVKII